MIFVYNSDKCHLGLLGNRAVFGQEAPARFCNIFVPNLDFLFDLFINLFVSCNILYQFMDFYLIYSLTCLFLAIFCINLWIFT